MGNVTFIKDRKFCIKPLRSRLEAIKKLWVPKTPKVREVLWGRLIF